MIKFKDFISGQNQTLLSHYSVEVTSKLPQQTLFLEFNSKDILTNASYSGLINPWLGSLCSIVIGKGLNELMNLSQKEWDRFFESDQLYWDMKLEIENQFFFLPLELLKAGLNKFIGREYLYKEESPLICRCFGVRERDVLEYIRKNADPTPEGLASSTRAGMGCRSCLPQLKKWLLIGQESTSETRYFKGKPRADWLLEIDYMLGCFPEALSWKMEVTGFKGTHVTISFEKDVSQQEEEKVAVELQDFLGAALDLDLSFFLVRARHRSKA